MLSLLLLTSKHEATQKIVHNDATENVGSSLSSTEQIESPRTYIEEILPPDKNVLLCSDLIRTLYESEIRRLNSQNFDGLIAEYDCIAGSLALLAAEEDGTPMNDLPEFSKNANVLSSGIKNFVLLDKSHYLSKVILQVHVSCTDEMDTRVTKSNQNDIRRADSFGLVIHKGYESDNSEGGIDDMYSVGSLPRSDTDGEAACNRSGMATHSIFKTESDESMGDSIGGVLRPQSLSNSPHDFISEPSSPIDTTWKNKSTTHTNNSTINRSNSHSKKLLHLKTAISSADLSDSPPAKQPQEVLCIPSGVIITCTTLGQGLNKPQGWKTASTISLALSTSSCSTPRVRSRSQSIVRGDSTVWKLDGGAHSTASSPRMFGSSTKTSSSFHQSSSKYINLPSYGRQPQSQDGSGLFRGSVTSPTAATLSSPFRDRFGGIDRTADDDAFYFDRSSKERSNSLPVVVVGGVNAETLHNKEPMSCYRDLWNYF
mmetsp:Transcript_19417/g.27776  ORF Transcript_19417/g.27776 Transcript_19417/m.27776 type:complete len:485 (+) Transcript_19417:23-1477(+)